MFGDDEDQSHPCPECGCEMGSDAGASTLGLCEICYMSVSEGEHAYGSPTSDEEDVYPF